MSKLPILRARDLIKVANKQDFRYEHTQGSHFIFRRPSDGKVISIPVHKGHTLGRGITRALIKQMGLTDDECLTLLKK